MANHVEINSLDLKNFLTIIPKRQEIINKSPETPLPKDYPINKLAKALHPQKQYVKIEKIVEHNKDVKSFYLVQVENKPCAYFKAGQYLSVCLNIGNSKIMKPYSICSSPSEALKGKYTLTVKRADNGFASDYILNNWKVGDEIEVSAPEGRFYYQPLRDAKNIVGIAGGSGITPFYSLAHAIAEKIEDCNLTLIYGSRREKDILFKEEFDKLQTECSKIKVIYVLSDEKVDNVEHGFITSELIKKYAPEDDYSLFICGNQDMYKFVDKEIEKLNLPLRRVRHELFGQFKNPEKESDYPKDIGKEFKLTVNIRGEKKIIKCMSDETLLVAMERGGIKAPSRCRSGECGYCRSRLISGKIYIPSSVDNRREADEKFGYMHPCCAFPLSNIEIDVPVNEI